MSQVVSEVNKILLGTRETTYPIPKFSDRPEKARLAEEVYRAGSVKVAKRTKGRSISEPARN